MEARIDYHTRPDQIQAMYEALAAAENEKKQGKSARLGAILSRIAFALVALLLCAALANIWIARYRGEAPTVLGHQFYSVETPSMEPTLPVGSIILSKKLTDDMTISLGDIITFRRNGSFVTHRVISCYQEDGVPCFRTQGDNPENGPDPWVLHRADIEAVCLKKLW